jgi:hypothetical protein
MGLAVLAKVAVVFIAAVAFVAPVVITAAPAHADAVVDSSFFQFLDQKGVPYGRKMDAVRIAKQTCLGISRPGDTGLIGYRVYSDLKKELGLNNEQTQNFVYGSVYHYCPQVWHIDKG